MFGYDYEGEVDENGKACGIGVAKQPKGETNERLFGAKQPETIEGTFFNNFMHGICE